MDRASIAVSGWYGRGNIGDELMLDAIVGELHSAGAVPIVLSAEPEETRRRHPGVHIVPNHTPVQRLRAFERADGVLLGGGGLIRDLAPEASGAGQFLDLVLSSSVGTPCLYFGVSCDTISVPAHARTARMLLRGARGAVVRDPKSAEALIELGMPRGSVTVGADPVLLDARVAPANPATRFAMALILSRHALDHLGRQEGGRAGAEFQRILADLAVHRSQQFGLPVLLPVFCREPSADDLPVTRALAEELGARDVPTQVEDVSNATQADVISLLAASGVTVSMRFHGCLLAYLAGATVIVVGLEQKTTRLGSTLTVVSPTASFDWLLSQVEGAARHNDPLATQEEIERTRTALARFLSEVRGRRGRPSVGPLLRFAYRRVCEHRARVD